MGLSGGNRAGEVHCETDGRSFADGRWKAEGSLGFNFLVKVTLWLYYELG